MPLYAQKQAIHVAAVFINFVVSGLVRDDMLVDTAASWRTPIQDCPPGCGCICCFRHCILAWSRC